MVQENSLKKVVVIVGPTAVGKTSISIKLAKKYHTSIINADQSQMHKDLNIGTAKITKEEMDGVKHYLIDFLSPLESYSIKDFQDSARNIIDNLTTLPLIVGGSGLYVDSLITDYDLSSPSRNTFNSTKYDNLSNKELYEKLKELNVDASNKTHPNNRKRVLRYLEIVEEKGTIEVRENKPYYNSLIILLNNDREEIYNNINTRTIKMIDSGWIEEAKSLRNSGIDLSLIKEIGYKDINDYLDNLISKEELIDKIQKETRHYAKRQLTWFKNKMHCIEVKNDNNAFSTITKLIDDFLNN